MTDDAFAALAEKVIRQAAKINCSVDEYKAGLELIVEELEVAVEAATEDLRRTSREGEK